MNKEFSHLHNSFKYRPDIDGLRALAVIPVILFHANLGFPGGYVGVDIFFVISGYLITSLIAREMIKGDFSYKDFWERRIRRIFPPAAFVTILTVIAGVGILFPEAYADLGKAALAQISMTANFYFWQQDGYFANASELEPLLHMWSLSVEEQFYFVLPFLLTALIKRGERRTRQILTLLFFASLIWSFYGIHYYKAATFYLLPARAWELLLGSLLALLPLPAIKSGTTRQILALLGLGLILWSFLSYSLITPFPGFGAIPPCIGTGLLIYAHQSGTSLVASLLQLKPVVFIGKISFSLYLWHWPLLVYGRHLSIHEMSLSVRVTLVVCSFFLALFSWKFIETPFRKKRIGAKRSKLFHLFWWTSGLSALICTLIYKLDGIPLRFQGESARFAAASEPDSAVPDIDKNFHEFPLINEKSKAPIRPVLLWGDSHARGMAALFQELYQEAGINGYCAPLGGTPPLLGVNRLPDEDHIASHNDRVLEAIDRYQIKQVILIARWAYYYSVGKISRDATLSDRATTGRPPEIVYQEALTRTIKELLQRGIEVTIMKQVPLQFRSPPATLWMAQRFGYNPDEIGITIQEHLDHQKEVNKLLDSIAQPGVTVLDPLEFLVLKNQRTKIQQDQNILYFDRNHLSQPGTKLLKPLFEPLINKLKSMD